jgi:hypothetical protein
MYLAVLQGLKPRSDVRPVMSQEGADDGVYNWMDQLIRRGESIGDNPYMNQGDPTQIKPLTREEFRLNKPGQTYSSWDAITQQMIQDYMRRMAEAAAQAGPLANRHRMGMRPMRTDNSDDLKKLGK